MNLMIGERKVLVKTEITPQKSINENFLSNVAFVLESEFMHNQLAATASQNQEYCLKDGFSIAWMILQLFQDILKKVGEINYQCLCSICF